MHLSFSAVGEDLYDGSSPVANDGGYNITSSGGYESNGGYRWAQGAGMGIGSKINL